MDERTRNARELLERWSASTSLDPYGPSWKLQTDPPPTRDPIQASRQTELERRPNMVETSPRETRGDSSRADAPSAHTADAERLADPSRSSAEPTPDQQTPRLHAYHTAPRPHLDIPPLSAEEESEQSNWLTWAGQILAYVGVLGLTLGASLVLWSHFGGPATYAPTGWLITTAAQMLLFLGVITLVSGGLEQTTETVTRRIDRLGERMLRFEQATREAVAPRPQTPIDTFRQDADVAASRNERVVAMHNPG